MSRLTQRLAFTRRTFYDYDQKLGWWHNLPREDNIYPAIIYGVLVIETDRLVHRTRKQLIAWRVREPNGQTAYIGYEAAFRWKGLRYFWRKRGSTIPLIRMVSAYTPQQNLVWLQRRFEEERDTAVRARTTWRFKGALNWMEGYAEGIQVLCRVHGLTPPVLDDSKVTAKRVLQELKKT